MQIHSNITQASTLPATFYRSENIFQESIAKIFERTWHYVADSAVIANTGQYYPFTLLDGVINEPLLLTHHSTGDKFCLSNVCTHRGKIIAENAGQGKLLTCGYHGRCFEMNGQFRSMPAFKGVQNFPSTSDHLTQVSLSEWFQLMFVSIQPSISLAKMLEPMMKLVGWMPLEKMQFNASQSREFMVKAHWALYCDNYLEGFHIPFVHKSLNDAIVFDEYEYRLFPYVNLQVAIAKEGQPHFELPPSSPDYGKKIYAYYFWLFPNVMFNFYPWGLSLNVIEPLDHQTTKVIFRTYLFNQRDSERSINRIDETEYEDEAVVESVQNGIQSRFYKKGRFSPTMEQCVHHFHQLIAQFMED